MEHLTQRYILDPPESASPVLPMHVALTAPDGGPVLGELPMPGEGATTAELAGAYRALALALSSAGLATLGTGGEPAAPAAAGAPSEEWTKDEIASWAIAHGIDLAGCRTKSDQLSVISAELGAGE